MTKVTGVTDFSHSRPDGDIPYVGLVPPLLFLVLLRLSWLALLITPVVLCQTPSTALLTPLNYQPLTRHQRWHRYGQDTILSPGLYFGSAGAASGAQLGNDPPEWGQGAAAYGKRTASILGTFLIQETVAQGGAALLGYDPRYLHCDCRGFWRRSGHAVKWSFLTKNTEGKTRLDVPSLASAYAAGMLSTYWYPARFNPLTDGVRNGNQQEAFTIGVNILKEFSPELKRLFRRRRATVPVKDPQQP